MHLIYKQPGETLTVVPDAVIRHQTTSGQRRTAIDKKKVTFRYTLEQAGLGDERVVVQ
jgi:hypothetical protein